MFKINCKKTKKTKLVMKEFAKDLPKCDVIFLCFFRVTFSELFLTLCSPLLLLFSLSCSFIPVKDKPVKIQRYDKTICNVDII